MPYIYINVDSLEGRSKVGSGACAVLVQHYAHAPLAAKWREGITVLGNPSLIAKGTAIATFVNGAYPNQPEGNHAAFYISQNASGIRVMDQWTSKLRIASRFISRKGKDAQGNYIDPSNNADAFSVIN